MCGKLVLRRETSPGVLESERPTELGFGLVPEEGQALAGGRRVKNLTFLNVAVAVQCLQHGQRMYWIQQNLSALYCQELRV